METFVIVLSIIWSLLCIILFFKIWGMTNDVSAIRELLEKWDIQGTNPVQINAKETSNQTKLEQQQSASASKESDLVVNGFKVEQLVVNIKNQAQMRINEITSEGNFICRKAGTTTIAGEFKAEEIEDFDEYWAKHRKR